VAVYEITPALLTGMQISLLKRLGTHYIMHLHTINTKKAEHFTKSATRLSASYGANLGSSFVRSERVALSIASEHATCAGTSREIIGVCSCSLLS